MALFSQTKDFLSHSFSQPHGQLSFFAVAGASFGLGLAFYRLVADSPAPKILASPRQSLLPKLSDSELSELALPPDVLPGARDVATPYGTIRVYEWGPEDGKKVLFIHGITTPCIALGDVAHHLAHKGCRVMLFDLYGSPCIVPILQPDCSCISIHDQSKSFPSRNYGQNGLTTNTALHTGLEEAILISLQMYRKIRGYSQPRYFLR